MHSSGAHTLAFLHHLRTSVLLCCASACSEYHCQRGLLCGCTVRVRSASSAVVVHCCLPSCGCRIVLSHCTARNTVVSIMLSCCICICSIAWCSGCCCPHTAKNTAGVFMLSHSVLCVAHCCSALHCACTAKVPVVLMLFCFWLSCR